MKQYRMARGWAMFVYVAISGFLGLCGWLIIQPFVGVSEGMFTWVLSAVALVVAAVCVAALIDVRTGVFVIDVDKVYTKGVFFNRSLRFDEIKGYRVDDKYLYIIPRDAAKKQVEVSVYFAGIDEIKRWLDEHYFDLGVEDFVKETKEILSDEDYGWSTEQRSDRLILARKVAKGLNICGIAAGLWVFAYPHPLSLAVHVAAIVPLVAILLMKSFKGLIRINEYDQTAYPTILWAIMGSAGGLLMRVLFSYRVYNYDGIWLPTLLVSVALMVLILLGDKEFKAKDLNAYATMVAVFLFITMYAYAVTLSYNCLYDTHAPEAYTTEIISKRSTPGKKPNYYFTVGAWGPETKENEIEVGHRVYDELSVGDSVIVEFHKGKINVPWLVVQPVPDTGEE